MAQATFNVSMEERLGQQFDSFCRELGMTVSSAVRAFAQAVVRERKMPFEISAEREMTREKALKAFYDLRDEAKKNGVQDMTLDEINEEIRLARAEKLAAS